MSRFDGTYVKLQGMAAMHTIVQVCPGACGAGVALVGQILTEALWSKFVGPVLLWPLLVHRSPLPAWAAAAAAKAAKSTDAATVSAAASQPVGQGRKSDKEGTTRLPSGAYTHPPHMVAWTG